MRTSTRNFWVLISMFLVGILGAVSVMLINGDKTIFNETEKQLNQTMGEVASATQEYNNFMVQAQEKEADNSQIEVVDSEVITKENKKVMTISKFAELIGIEINADNKFVYDEFQVLSNDYTVRFDGDNQDYVLFDELLEALGYTYAEEQGKVVVSRAYYSKRLVVEGEVGNISSANQLNVLGNTILQFETEKDAADNYAEMSKDYSVFIDAGIKLDPEPVVEDEELAVQGLNNAEGSSSYSTHRGTHFNSWGGDLMGFYYYNNYLQQVCGDNLRDTTVVVMDSGINYDHQIFKGRLSPYSMSFIAGKTSAQYKDDLGHGTHVAGTICELTTSNVKILTIKILDQNGNGYKSAEILGFSYVLRLIDSGLNICAINASFGGYVANFLQQAIIDMEESKISEIRSKGVLFCAAAGNESKDANEHNPSCFTSSISISSISRYSRLSIFSNYGSSVKFTAPGEHILSASHETTNDLCDMSGTSMSTPHITAAVAAVASDSRNNYTADQIEQLLINTCAVDLGETGKDDKFGFGYINLRKLIENYEDQYSDQPKDYKVYIGIDRETYDKEYGSRIICDYTTFARSSKTITVRDNYNSSGRYVDYGIYNINTVSKLSFDINVIPEYELIGWYVGVNTGRSTTVNNYNQDAIYSSNKTITLEQKDWQEEELYVIAKIKRRVIDVKILFVFENVASIDGYMFYGVGFSVSRMSLNNVNFDTHTNIRQSFPENGYKYTSYRAEDRVFTFEDVPLGTDIILELSLEPNEAEIKDNTIFCDDESRRVWSKENNPYLYSRYIDIENTNPNVQDFVITITILV